VQVDAQLDSLQVQAKNIEFDPLDVPRDRFLVAGDAWLQHRAGTIDAATCGILDMWGEWYIAGNLALDMASLQNVEFLPWEPWGMLGVPDGPGAAPAAAADANHALVDDIAGLTLAADELAVGKLLAMARNDVRVRPNAKTIEAALAADAAGSGTGANPLASR
jgi:hypothetical protein